MKLKKLAILGCAALLVTAAGCGEVVKTGQTAQPSALPTTDATIVNLNPGADIAAFSARVVAAGGEVVFSLPQINVIVVRNAGDALGSAAVQSASEDLIIPHGAVHAEAAATEYFPQNAFFWALQYGIRQVKADVAINAGYTGAGAKVAIIDTGIYYPHPDLASTYVGGKNFFAPFCKFDPNPLNCNPDDALDDNGHGSHVSGIVAGQGLGVIGVAPGAKLLGAKVCGRNIGCPTSSIVAAIVYAANEGVDVMNLSLGGFVFNFLGRFEAADFTAFTRATNYANSKGSLVVNSAGNEGLNLDQVFTLFNGHLQRGFQRILGTNNNVIVVSALGPFEEAGNIFGDVYTNTGSIVDISGPGGSYPPLSSLILSTWSPLSPDLPGASYVWAAGTSMSSPHVAGGAAQVAAKYPQYGPSQIRTTLLQSSDDLGRVGTDPLHGAGRLNVARAVGVEPPKAP